MTHADTLTRPDATALAERAHHLIDAGRLGAAAPVAAALDALEPLSARSAIVTARLTSRGGDPHSGLSRLDAAISRDPADGSLRRVRAELRLLVEDRVGAVQDAAEAVVLDPEDAQGKGLLGIALIELELFADAVACLAESVRHRPGDARLTEALAWAVEHQGDAASAASILDDGIVRAPRSPQLRVARIMTALRAGDAAQAASLAAAARQAGVVDARVVGLHGHALSALGCHEDAAEAYREALKLAPEDAYVRHLAGAAGAVPAGARAPGDYVRAVFDAAATRFEGQLVGLGYRVPGLVRRAVERHVPLDANHPVGPVLDLGCGTGLLAVVLADLPLACIDGIDLSAAMLAEARAKNLYRTLRQADLLTALAEPAEPAALALAGDVLCYFGDLLPLFHAVHARLTPGGLFIASVETASDPDAPAWSLGPLGRYAHAPGKLRLAAEQAGYAVREVTPEVLRQERGAPVAGAIVVLERRHAG